MSLRKAKMLLEHKKAQQKRQNVQEQSQQSEDQEPIIQQKSNMFDGFGGDTDSDEDAQNRQKQQEESKPEVETQQKKKKKKKKKKQTEQQQLEQALKQMGMEQKKQDKKSQKNKEQFFEEGQGRNGIFDINESKFNYEKQLRRHFRDWQQEKPDKEQNKDKRYQRMQKHLQKAMKKSILCPSLKQFFPIREKFELQHCEEKQTKETPLRLLKFVPSKKYEQLQAEYEGIKNSDDINAMFHFTQMHPEHVDSIYSVGQFLRLQGNYRDADALIQRVVYIYEVAGAYEMAQFINKEGKASAKLIYDAYSTSFFMSLFKFMEILGKKGCFRAALEYNKLLLKINTADPTACMLCLDYNAISSKQYEYLSDFITTYSAYVNEPKTSLYLMPNFIYSFALARFHIQNTPRKIQNSELLVEENNITETISFGEDDWQRALKLPNDLSFLKQNCRTLILRAIMVYPRLMLDIASHNEYRKQFLNHPKFQNHQKQPFKANLDNDFWKIVPQSYSYHFLRLQSEHDSRGLDKVLEVYVERSKILYKSNEVMLWMKAAIGFILNQIEKGFDYQAFLEGLCTEESGGMPIPFSLDRFENIYKANFSDRVDRVDLNNIQDNQQMMQQQQEQNANRINLEGNGFSLFLNSLLPWVNLPAEQQGNDPNMPFIEEDQDF